MNFTKCSFTCEIKYNVSKQIISQENSITIKMKLVFLFFIPCIPLRGLVENSHLIYTYISNMRHDLWHIHTLWTEENVTKSELAYIRFGSPLCSKTPRPWLPACFFSYRKGGSLLTACSEDIIFGRQDCCVYKPVSFFLCCISLDHLLWCLPWQHGGYSSNIQHHRLLVPSHDQELSFSICITCEQARFNGKSLLYWHSLLLMLLAS